jgi:hypothetical protein
MPFWELFCESVIGTGGCHEPLRAALSGSLIKAPGFAGGYLPAEETVFFPRLVGG